MSEEIEVREKLKSNVSALYEMELNNYFMTKTIKAMNGAIGKMGHPKHFEPPTRQKMVSLYQATGGFAGVGLGIGGGIGLSAGSIGAGLIVGLLLGLIIGFAIDMNGREKAQRKADAEYEQALAKYQTRMASEKRRLDNESKCKSVLIADRDALVQKRQESTALLSAMYDAVGIDKEYRHLIAIGYMDTYIRLGVANKLEGVDGLYYIVEQKIDKRLFQLTLDEISDKLDTIADKLSQISSQLEEMNQKFDRSLKASQQAINVGIQNGQTLAEIRENTGISAYNNERMRREYEFRNMVGWN